MNILKEVCEWKNWKINLATSETIVDLALEASSKILLPLVSN